MQPNYLHIKVKWRRAFDNTHESESLETYPLILQHLISHLLHYLNTNYFKSSYLHLNFTGQNQESSIKYNLIEGEIL